MNDSWNTNNVPGPYRETTEQMKLVRKEKIGGVPTPVPCRRTTQKGPERYRTWSDPVSVRRVSDHLSGSGHDTPVLYKPLRPGVLGALSYRDPDVPVNKDPISPRQRDVLNWPHALGSLDRDGVTHS